MNLRACGPCGADFEGAASRAGRRVYLTGARCPGGVRPPPLPALIACKRNPQGAAAGRPPDGTRIDRL